MFKWFQCLFGFEEFGIADGNISAENYLRTQSNFSLKTDTYGNITLVSNVNNREFAVGRFSTPSLGTLRSWASTKCFRGNVSYSHVVGDDALLLHAQNPGATFQAASQFNCLEFPSPDSLPENGVTMYAVDNTQGPACAVACAAGTVYRNYFSTPVSNPPGQVGQSEHSQINNLDELEKLLENDTHQYFHVRNGYTFSDRDSLSRLNTELDNWKKSGKWDKLMETVKIGLQENVGVTFAKRFTEVSEDVRVHQVYASALSCGYSGVDNLYWKSLASLVLDAMYEATILAALYANFRSTSGDVTVSLSSESTPTIFCSGDTDICTSPPQLFLTFLGGGVFRNEPEWIASAIGKAIAKVSVCYPGHLQVSICHYRKIREDMQQLIDIAYEEEVSRLLSKINT